MLRPCLKLLKVQESFIQLARALIGSFDFNTECIGRERYDAGIKTRHPDLVRSAVELFEQIWNEAESIPLEEFVEKGKG